MSEKSDRERAEESRHAASIRSDGILSKLRTLRALWLDGKSDAEISEVLGGAGSGWSRKSVKRYRQVLQLALGKASGGKWSAL